MKKFTSTLFAIAIIIIISFNSHAQNKSVPSAIAPEKRALIKELIALSGQSSEQIADDVYDAQMNQAKGMMSRMLDSKESFSAADRAYFKNSAEESFDRMAKKLKEFFKTELVLDTYLEEVAVTSYDKYFSESELYDLLAFYKSPTGKKSINVGPEIMKDVMTYMIEKVMPKLEAFIKRTVDAEFALVKDKLPSQPTKRKGTKKSYSKTRVS